jgi:hypothetical protein
MLTAEQLQSIMPRLSAARNSELLPFLTAAMAEFAIEAPLRAAAFLAQLAHESGQFRFMEEIWGPTDAQRRYEPVTALSQDLGNTGPPRRMNGFSSAVWKQFAPTKANCGAAPPDADEARRSVRPRRRERGSLETRTRSRSRSSASRSSKTRPKKPR